jgi:hypothetical protein
VVIDTSVLLTVAVVLTAFALVVTYFIGVEVVGLVRGFFVRSSAARPPTREATGRRSKHDTGPLTASTKPLRPYEDRTTVERLIGYFEEGEEEESDRHA